MNFRISDKDEVLQRLDVGQRLRFILTRLEREVARARVMEDVKRQTEIKIEQHQREFYLRQQLRAIQTELGEADPGEKETDRHPQEDRRGQPPRESRTGSAARDRAHAHALARVERVPGHPHVPRLDPLRCPGTSARATKRSRSTKVESALDGRHYGLREAKERIIEFLAVRKLRGGDPHGPILCFVGPPGTGKTSLGEAIASAIGREFYRISVGGVRDEAEIRGHRRTYVGSMPGLILQALRRVQVQGSRAHDRRDRQDDRRRSVRRSDGRDARGARPVAEQLVRRSLPQPAVRPVVRVSSSARRTTCSTSRRRCATAWRSSASRATRSRRKSRSRGAICSRACSRSTASPTRTCSSPTRSLGFVSSRYSREAGLRNFERNLAAIMRKRARRKAEGEEGAWVIDMAKVEEMLGAPRYPFEEAETEPEIGAVTGLAWTATGGDLMVIEALRMPGTGRLDRHRPARRRDARVGRRRALLRALACGGPGDRREGVQGSGPAHPLPRRRDSRRTDRVPGSP